MGLSSSKQTTGPSKFARPYVQGAATNLQNVVNANAGQLQSNADTINSLIPGLAERVRTPDPLTEAAKGYSADVLGGRYLDAGNPFLNDMVTQTGDSVSNRVNSIFSRAGRTAGAQHEQLLGRELSDAENRLRYADYDAERTRMGQAAALTPGLVASELAPLESLLSATQLGSSLPYLGANTLASGMNGLMGGYNTITASPSLGKLLMDGAQAAAYAFSDPKLKKNVRRIGERADGLGVYEYEYRRDRNPLPKGKQVGVMADEVAERRPDALGPTIGGYRSVNYGAL